jgi:hypothetical protein
MRKAELLKRIEALEAQVALLMKERSGFTPMPPFQTIPPMRIDGWPPWPPETIISTGISTSK